MKPRLVVIHHPSHSVTEMPDLPEDVVVQADRWCPKDKVYVLNLEHLHHPAVGSP